MSDGISFMEIPSGKCVLCGVRMCSHGSVAYIETQVVTGLVCSRCLWSISQADDPREWCAETACACEFKAIEYRAAAQLLRRLSECDLGLPSREELEEAGYGDPPF